MDRHLLDRIVAGVALVLVTPLLCAVAVGIRLSSPGPILFYARRVGRGGSEFRLVKFRTMRVDQGQSASAITAAGDWRIFPFGRWLRRWKLDELPQLVNVLRGELALVGPRPEDPRIVKTYYRGPAFKTLRVRPGLTSPGSLYNHTHGERMLHEGEAEHRYINELLPTKLALDLIYIRRASFRYDAHIVWRTLSVLAACAVGREKFSEPVELAEARQAGLPAACTPTSVTLNAGHVARAASSSSYPVLPPEPIP